jgi:ubiquinone/menaquinone biosynthesis C-methylase UbiE
MMDSSRREFFDRKAVGWDDRNHPDDIAKIRELIERFNLRPTDWILDVGTGNGVLLPFLSAKVKRGRIFALDFSGKMIWQAKRNHQKKNISFLNASVEALPIKDRELDCITCFSMFAHVCDKKGSLLEMSRVLKMGGRLYIVHPFGKKELAGHHKSAGGAVEHDILPPDPAMKKMMTGCGFHDIRIIDRPGLYWASAKR